MATIKYLTDTYLDGCLSNTEYKHALLHLLMEATEQGVDELAAKLSS